MAVKTFTTGEVLTAADTNSYLNNGGLVYIKEVSIPAGTTTAGVSVSSCFSSTYDNYRVVYQINSQSADGYTRIQFNNQTGSFYYDGGIEMAWTSTTVTGLGSAVGTTARLGRYVSGLTRVQGVIDIYSPNVATRTWATAQSSNPGYSWNSAIQEASDTAHTGFTLSPSTGTWTGGTIRVYGYRQA